MVLRVTSKSGYYLYAYGNNSIVSRSFAVLVMLTSYSVPVQSYVSGKLDTLLETEKTAYFTRNRIEEQVDLNWSHNNKEIDAGFQFDLGHQKIEDMQLEETTDSQVNQLFIHHRSNDMDYTLGRFNRADKLGFYTLDGLTIKLTGKRWGGSFHAGKPLQIEDYNIIDADSIAGFDITHKSGHIGHLSHNINSHIGWQQITQDITKQNYIHWEISGNGDLAQDSPDQKTTDHIEYFFNGSYLHENNSVESVNAGAKVFFEDKKMAGLVYSRWHPQKIDLSFKERFYSVYGRGKQSILQADFFHGNQWDRQYYIRTRKIWREFGDDGYGATAGFEKKTNSDKYPDWQTQWDYLVLKDDLIHTLYLGADKDLSATIRGQLNTALQYKKNDSTKDDRLIAVEAIAEQMLNTNLYLNFNARYIFDQDQPDEYRVGFRLSYRFDDRIRSGR